MDLLLGLDVGTTATKALLFDPQGNIVSSASHQYGLITPQERWVEQDPEEIWLAVIAAIRSAVQQLDSIIRISAVCMAAQSGSLIPADIDGNPVYPIITWMDGRTESLVQRWLEEGVQAKVKSISGWSHSPGLCLPTIAWLKKK